MIRSTLSRFFVVGLAAAALLLGGSVGRSATSTTDASRAAVGITDSGFAPKVVRIAPRGRVTWTNRGQQPHVVTSLTGAFRAFALRPGAARTLTFARRGSHPYLVDTQCGVVLVGVSRGGCPKGLGGGSRSRAYRAVASLSINETFPTITHPCSSRGFRRIEWSASVPRLELVRQTGQPPFLWSKKKGAARFATFESRVVSPCPGAFDNRLSGTQFQLDIGWKASDNTLRVSTKAPGVDEGEGDGWGHVLCAEAPKDPSSETVLLGEAPDSPKYTDAQTKLTAAERRAILGHKRIRIRRTLDRNFPCSGFGGERGFDVKAGLDVQLIPVR